MRLVLLLLLLTHLYASERIITLSPAVGEIVSGLGSESEIVGVSEYSFVPESLQKKPSVGGYFSLSLEKILALKPSLVIGLPHQHKTLTQLEQFHIHTLELPLERIADIKSAITTIAKVLHKEPKAREMIADISNSELSVPKRNQSQKVLIVFANASGVKKGVYVAGHDLYFEEILHLCGAQNAYNDDYHAQPLLHMESLISTNPDTVILLFGPQDQYVEKEVLDSWMILPINAVKNNRIKIIQSDYLLIPSQRVAKSIQTLCKAIQ